MEWGYIHMVILEIRSGSKKDGKTKARLRLC